MSKDLVKVSDVLPHREPFLFLDRIVSHSDRESVGVVTFGPERDFFRGHFPQHPIVPGVILLEAMCQSAAAGVLSERLEKADSEDLGILLFAGADNVRFRRPVQPGETLETRTEVRCLGHGIGKFRTWGYVGDELAVEADLTCMESREANI